MDQSAQKIRLLERRIEALETKRITQQDVLPKAIKQRHLEAYLIFVGTAANRPTGGSTEIQFYFATDTNAFSAWNGTSWKSTTLS